MTAEEKLLQEIIARLDKLGAGFQPLDSDLTAIAALTTTPFGRSLLTLSNSAALAALVAASFDAAGAAATAETNAKTYADGLVVGLWDDRGNFDASVNAYPSSGGSGIAGAIKKGDIWTVSVAGILPTALNVEIGDTVRALIDTPGNTQANWAIAQQNIGYVPENSTNKDIDGTLSANSDLRYASQKAIKTYVDNAVLGAGGSSGEDLTVTTYDTTNVTGSSACSYYWHRIGDYVFVTGQVVINVTATNTFTELGVDLPIASNFTSAPDISGVVNRLNNVAQTGVVANDNVNDRAVLSFYSGAQVGAWGYHFHFSYKVKP